MTEMQSPYVFCEYLPTTSVSPETPTDLIHRAIEQLTEILHAQGGPWSSAEHRAVAALQAALYHLSAEYA